MVDEENKHEKTKAKRFRSPPYPAFDLEKAVERCELLFDKAHHHEVGVNVIMEAWDMESSGGKVWRHAAALLQYCLLSDSGSGRTRKFKLTDVARRLIQDKDATSEKRKKALEVAALHPMIHEELFSHYGIAKGLSDSVLKTYLTIDRAENGEYPYSPSAADDVINTYRATLAYAGFSNSDVIDDTEAYKVGDTGQSVPPNPGENEFPEATVVEQPESIRKEPPPKRGGDNIPPFTVYQVGNRLQITADVDAEGLKKLEILLKKYQEILELLE